MPPPPNDLAQASRLYQAGRFSEAVPLFRRALKKQPKNPTLLHQLGCSLAMAGDLRAGIDHIQRALRLRPNEKLYLVDLGQFQMIAGRPEQADRAFDAVLRIDPGFAFAKGSKIELYQTMGDHERARAVAEPAVEEHPDDLRLLVAYAKLAPRIGAEHKALSLLESLLERETIKPDARVHALFRIADLRDRLGQHEEAFDTAAEGNELLNARYNPAAWTAAIDRTIAAWTPEAAAAAPRSAQSADLPVLIVGVMRSGTSLIEQMLDCHPLVHGAGELTLIDNTALGLRASPPTTHQPLIDDPAMLTRKGLEEGRRAYLAELYKRGGKAKRVTDKMPGNLTHLGLVDRMLPGARVIHCRRDPRDTAVSCFLHNFMGQHPWTTRLDWIASYINATDRLMAHWAGALELPILCVDYERLVEDPEPTLREILAFVGLEWDPACLAFHESKRVTITASNEQVRQPLYTSAMGRWKRYESRLGPLLEALGSP